LKNFEEFEIPLLSMCGIAGIVKKEAQKYQPQLKKMTDSLRL